MTTPAAPIATDERDRSVISLPPQTTLYSSDTFLAIAFDTTANTTLQPTVLGPNNNEGLPYLQDWRLIGHLCNRRAIATVDGTLSVAGKRITPERYLKLWRDAIANPLTPDQFARRYDRIPCATLAGPLAPLRDVTRSYTTSPFTRFRDFEARYRDQMQIAADESSFELVLDLRQPDAPRHAYYASQFLVTAQIRKLPGPYTTSITVPRTGQIALPYIRNAA